MTPLGGVKMDNVSTQDVAILVFGIGIVVGGLVVAIKHLLMRVLTLRVAKSPWLDFAITVLPLFLGVLIAGIPGVGPAGIHKSMTLLLGACGGTLAVWIFHGARQYAKAASSKFVGHIAGGFGASVGPDSLDDLKS